MLTRCSCFCFAKLAFWQVSRQLPCYHCKVVDLNLWFGTYHCDSAVFEVYASPSAGIGIAYSHPGFLTLKREAILIFEPP